MCRAAKSRASTRTGPGRTTARSRARSKVEADEGQQAVIGFLANSERIGFAQLCLVCANPETLPRLDIGSFRKGDAASRLVAVAAQGVASRPPYMVGSSAAAGFGWLPATVPLSLIRPAWPWRSCPTPFKNVLGAVCWIAAFAWPDRRRAGCFVLQLTLVMVNSGHGPAAAQLPMRQPDADRSDGGAAGRGQVASQDIAVGGGKKTPGRPPPLPPHRTCLPARRLGGGAAALFAGYRGAMFGRSAPGGFVLAGRFGWPVAFLAAAALNAGPCAVHAWRAHGWLRSSIR